MQLQTRVAGLDVFTTSIGFVTDGPGPPVLCEQPYERSSKRHRPLDKPATIHLGSQELPTRNASPPAVEVDGPALPYYY
jgi:hypothetical protein